MPTTATDKPPHPDYGLADETRLAILRDASLVGVRCAAEMHGVSDQAIRSWRKRYALVPTTQPAKEASE